MSELKTVVCNKCNWTSFAVTRAYAEAEVKLFNAQFAMLSQELKDEYYGGKGSSLAEYSCQRCGSESFTPGNTALTGSTISPVIYEEVDQSYATSDLGSVKIAPPLKLNRHPTLCSEHATLIPVTGSAMLDSDECEVCALIERCKA
jgi:predicted nucleic-acid-binding Zn-ribbon protein